MSQAVGTNPSKGGRVAVDGPWLDGSHGHTVNKTWYCYGKESDVVRPSPAQLWIFVDEDEYSINDGGFAVDGPGAPVKMIDWPGSYHNNACGFAFADGHSEIHKWKDPRTKVLKGNVTAANQAGNQDIIWMQQGVSAKIN